MYRKKKKSDSFTTLIESFDIYLKSGRGDKKKNKKEKKYEATRWKKNRNGRSLIKRSGEDPRRTRRFALNFRYIRGIPGDLSSYSRHERFSRRYRCVGVFSLPRVGRVKSPRSLWREYALTFTTRLRKRARPTPLRSPCIKRRLL